MRFSQERTVLVVVLGLAVCTIAVMFVLLQAKQTKTGSLPRRSAATYIDKSLGIRVTLPQPWIMLSASEAALVTREGKAALAESEQDTTKLGIEHPDPKARLLTAMNPATGDSFQILKQADPPSESESNLANDLRSTLVNLVRMQALGPVERMNVKKPVAHFNGRLTLRGTPVYQSIFVVVAHNTAIAFVFSGPAERVMSESKQSFPLWVSFDSATPR